MKRSMVRFLPVALLLIATAIFLQARSHGEVFPRRQPLESFPQQLGSWESTDLPIPEESLQVLGPGDYMLRSYDDPLTSQPPVQLFIAYVPSQRAGNAIHSPQNCYPGHGWSAVQSSRMMLSIPNHAPIPVNRYVIARGDAREFVLYWYWAHDRGVASEYWAKYYLVADSIRMNRSDGSLIRLTTDMQPGENADAAMQRVLPFAARVVPLLDDYIPR